MWITREAVKAKDKSVAGHGDKRQFTLLASTAATGESLPDQVVVKGATSKSLPDFGVGCQISINAKNTKGHQSVCFRLLAFVAAVANITSFCATCNHWSDDVTSRAYVQVNVQLQPHPHPLDPSLPVPLTPERRISMHMLAGCGCTVLQT